MSGRRAAPPARGGGNGQVPAADLRRREPVGEHVPGGHRADAAGVLHLRQRADVRRRHGRRGRAAADGDGDHGHPEGQRRGHDRRAVRRDQGAARRVLPGGGEGPGRRDPVGGQDSEREARRPDRGAPGAGVPGRARAALSEAPAREVVDRLFRHESGRAVATLIRVTGDFDLAEEAVQEAFLVALERWPRDGLPDNPGAWITVTARNKALDRLRREKRLAQKREALAALERLRVPAAGVEATAVPDDRLRLMFTCCHPALAPEARVALTLRTLGGLTTAEIARAFLVPEPTLAQRLVRARRKIREA